MLPKGIFTITLGFLYFFVCQLPSLIAVAPPPGFSSPAPMIDFTYPQMNEDGLKIWSFSGTEGYLIPDDQSLKVNKMTLTTFMHKDGKAIPDTILESDSALIFTEQKKAESSEAVTAKGEGFQMSGTGWICDQAVQKIIIKSNVQVLFTDSLQKVVSSQNQLQ